MRLFCETFGLVDTTSLLSLQRLNITTGKIFNVNYRFIQPSEQDFNDR